MKHRKVTPDEIKIPETRVTARFDEETWAQFQGSMEAMGAIAPIICCEVEGQFILVDGLHRLIEAKRLNQTTVDVVLIPGDMIDVLTKNIFLDRLRGKTPVSEMVDVIEVLWKEYALDSDQIAEKTGMTRDYIEKLQKISELTPYCREALNEGKMSIGHAVALTKIKDPIRQEVVFRQLELYGWKVKEFEAYVEDILKIVEEREQAPEEPGERQPPKLDCFYCKGKFDPAEVAYPCTCRECSSLMIASMAAARREYEEEQKQKQAAGVSQKLDNPGNENNGGDT